MFKLGSAYFEISPDVLDDIRNLFSKWKYFVCRWSISTSFSISQGTLPWQPILWKNGKLRTFDSVARSGLLARLCHTFLVDFFYYEQSYRRRRSRASPVLTAIGLAYGNPVYLTPHTIDVP